MERIHCFKNKIPNLWEPHFNGVFAHYEDAVHFHFLHNNSVYALNCAHGTIQQIAADAGGEIVLPRWWILSHNQASPLLMCGKGLCIDLLRKESTHAIPTGLKEEFLHKYQNYELFPEKRINTEPYTFGEYSLCAQGSWGYLCKKDGKEIWHFKGRASLATDIHICKDSLYWGTSGAGGYFYILDAESGEPKLSLQTGGTRIFCQNEDLCYLGRRIKNKSYIACVSLTETKVTEEFPLDGVFTDNSTLYLHDNTLYVITFSPQSQKERSLILTVLHC